MIVNEALGNKSWSHFGLWEANEHFSEHFDILLTSDLFFNCENNLKINQ